MAKLSQLVTALACAAAALATTGCASQAVRHDTARLAASPVPRELEKVSHPTYRAEPPDILLIEAATNVRRATTPLRSGEVLQISLGNPEPLSPIDPEASQLEAQFQAQFEASSRLVNGPYLIQPNGTVNLGPVYGSVQVVGMTVEDAEKAVTDHLTRYTTDDKGNPVGLSDPQVAVELPNIAGLQQIAGEHLVRPDGTIALGVYGSVYVAGQTLAEIKYAVEAQLSTYLQAPEVTVDVLAYNSKVIYVITDGGGYGEQVARLPVTGNETVLDAVAQIQGLSQVSSKKIWVSRPAPAGANCAQVLDVHWDEITREGITTTNYQLLPGDRIYISADKLIATDNFLAKLFAPLERTMGVILLGTSTARSIQFYDRFGRGFGNGGVVAPVVVP